MRAATVIAFAGLLAAAALAGGYDKLSPFTGVRFEGDSPRVEFEGEWYVPVSIDGRSVAEILAFARKRWPNKWRKRFAEDIVEVLTEMGKAPGRKVDLVLARPDSGEKVTRRQVKMTEDNRRRVLDGSDAISRRTAMADLAALRRLIEERFSYRGLRDVDLDEVFATAVADLPERVNRPDLSVRVRILLATFGDGHTRVSDSLVRDLGPGYLPFLVAHTDDGLVAFREDRSGFFDEKRPFLAAIDDVPVKEWVDAASVIVAAGSPQFVRRNAIRNLRYIGWLRKRLGRPAARKVRVTLTAAKGKNAREIPLRLAARKPNYGDWPRKETGLVDGDVGYLRIASMDDGPGFLEGLSAAMKRFEKTRALVIDVRGNGGGTRHALLTILPLLMAEKDAPRVVNVAKYRLPPDAEPGLGEGYLEDRFLYPATSDAWSSKERSVIQKFAKGFRPAWKPDKKSFSDWHYMLVSAGKGRPCRGPVFVLMDAGCFSATDIFLSAMKDQPGVKLVGTASGGGSGRSRSHTLPGSGIGVRISSMASFRAGGALYDGAGVKPHVEVPVRPTDLIGRSDSALEAVRKLIR
jgi:hypothetical protein